MDTTPQTGATGRSAIVTGGGELRVLTEAALALSEDYDRVTVIYPRAASTQADTASPNPRVRYLAVEAATESGEPWRNAVAAAFRQIGPVNLWLDLTSAPENEERAFLAA